MNNKTEVKRMFVLDGGSFMYGMGMMQMGKDLEKEQRIIVPIYAFDTDEGWVLYDTGFSPGAQSRLDRLGMGPRIAEDNTAVGQLRMIGVAPEDVTKVIISHLHVDHAGGIPFFPDADIYVQKDEFTWAQHPNDFQKTVYDRRIFGMRGVKWQLLAGDEVIVPGLTVMLANGHTPGLQGLIVELPETGYYLLGSDSVYLMENIENAHPPGSVWNTVLAEYAIKRFKALRSLLNGQFWPGHDFDFYHNELKLREAYC